MILQLASIAVIIAATSSGSGSDVVVIAVLTVFGLGLPAMFVPLYTFGSAPIPADQAGVGSGLLNTFNEAGAGVGLAIVAPISAAVIAQSVATDSPAASAGAGAHAGFLALAAVSVLAGVVAVALSRIANRDDSSSGASAGTDRSHG